MKESELCGKRMLGHPDLLLIMRLSGMYCEITLRTDRAAIEGNISIINLDALITKTDGMRRPFFI